jgi:predicted transcriptional regulator
MSARTFSYIELEVPPSYVKRLDAIARRNGTDRDAEIAKACADFLTRKHKPKGKP